MEKNVILPAGGKSHVVCLCVLQILLRKDRSLFVEVQSIDDGAGTRNYEMGVEFFGTAGRGLRDCRGAVC